MTKLTARLIKTGPNLQKQNMVWNMAGSFFYAAASMVLSFLVMRIVGEEEGGVFSFGYSTLGQQLFLLAYFGIRPYQITDGEGEYRFGDYFHHRCLTCALALLGGAAVLAVSGYGIRKAGILYLLILYKTADGFADVYESEFQRQGRLYLTGKSNTFRTILSVGIFLTVLTAGRNLETACMAAVAAQLAGIYLFDQSVLRELPGVDYSWDKKRLLPLTSDTALLFVSVFLDFYVFSAAKYAIDAHMDDAASGYFNLIFMPTSVINLAAGFVIRPFLTYLTDAWNQRDGRRFSRKLLQITLVIVGLAILGVGGAALLGRPVLRLLEWLLGASYEGRLTGYTPAFVMIVLGGGFYAVLNLYYYGLVIMRRQREIFGIYLAMAAAAAATAPRMVIQGGISGAAREYLALMVLMAAGFFAAVWLGYAREMRKQREEMGQ